MASASFRVHVPTTTHQVIADPYDPDAPTAGNPYGICLWLMMAERGSNIENEEKSFSRSKNLRQRTNQRAWLGMKSKFSGIIRIPRWLLPRADAKCRSDGLM